MKTIGIIGTRRRDTAIVLKLIKEKFNEIYEDGDIICSGGCSKGGDRFAEQIAKGNGIPILIVYPDYKRYGKAAALIRNGTIAKKSDVIIACVVHPEDGISNILERKKGGTEHTLRQFIKREDRKLEDIIIV
jgi:hypothetical protein